MMFSSVKTFYAFWAEKSGISASPSAEFIRPYITIVIFFTLFVNRFRGINCMEKQKNFRRILCRNGALTGQKSDRNGKLSAEGGTAAF